jgi:EAL domain-containing protein (putative c-di-GMP-specific phosphodiesterase class I)
VAADDVGAGNAGLRLLSQLRFDIVKIDLSLVQGGSGQNQSLEIVRTLRDLADRWGALVVAEGIETPAQLEVVRSLGIGAGQGYLLGRPSEQPPTTSVDLDGLIRGSDWLMGGLRAVPA